MSLTKSYSLYLLFVLPVQKRIQRRAKARVLLSVTSSRCSASARVSRRISNTFLLFFCYHLLMVGSALSFEALANCE